jgi:hypothetical protein
VSRVTIDGVRVAILGLDSSWLAEGGIEDHMNLLLGERQVINAIRLAQQAPDPPHILIAMSHHPLHLLQDFDRRPVQARIERECHFLHCGHLHEPEARSAGHTATECLTLAAGASFQGRHSRNVYSVVTLDLLRAWRVVKTLQYDPSAGRFASAAAQVYRIEVKSSATCSIRELAGAIGARSPAPWPHYLAALLLEQKAEILVPAPGGHTLASLAVMETLPDGDLKTRSVEFFAFRNALRILYGREPLDEIFRIHGDAVVRYGATLVELVAPQPTLKTRLDEQEEDARLLAGVEPTSSFSNTLDLLHELAAEHEWDILREQAGRHTGSAEPTLAEEARRMLALALANSTKPADKTAAIEIYRSLVDAGSKEPRDAGNLATLLMEVGQIDGAKSVVMDGIRNFRRSAVDYLVGIGHTIVETTGDRAFREQMTAAIAMRGDR